MREMNGNGTAGRSGDREPDRRRIVVGVDGSDAGRAALEWALDEAARRGAIVEAVHAWQPPVAGHTPAGYDPEGTERAAAAAFERMLRGVEVPAGTQLVRHLLCGEGGPVLVGRSRDAELLVVGSKDRNTFVGLLLGSAGRYVMRHATCPVVAVHDWDTRPRRGAHVPAAS